MDKVEAEKKLKDFDSELSRKNLDLQTLESEQDEIKSFGINPAKNEFDQRSGMFEGFGSLIGILIVIIILIIGFVISKLI